MPSFSESLGEVVKSVTCQILSEADNFEKWVNGGILGNVENTYKNGFARGIYRRLCNDEPPGNPPSGQEPGQCAGVNYGWTLTYEVKGGPYLEWTTINKVVNCPGVAKGPINVLGWIRQGENEAFYLEWSDGIGGRVRQFISDQYNTKVYRIRGGDLDLINCGGGSECGPVGPLDPPIGWNSQPVIINYTTNNNVDIDLNGQVTLNYLKVDVNGNLNIPLNVSIGDPTLNADIDFGVNIDAKTGDINLDLSPNINIDLDFNRPDNSRPDKDDPPPIQPPDTKPPNEKPDPDRPREQPVIRGVIATATSVNGFAKATVIGQGDNPDVYAPYLGLVSFYLDFGGSKAWTADIPVKNKRQFIPCPWVGGAVDVRGTPIPGVTWTLTPIYTLSDGRLPQVEGSPT